jgi:hypothetical protein
MNAHRRGVRPTASTLLSDVADPFGALAVRV